MLLAWYEGIQSDYHTLIFNQPGFSGVVGLQSLLVSAGFSLPKLSILAVFPVVFLWKFRKKINTEDVLGILMAITFTLLGHAHDYDYVGLIPLLTSLWIYASADRQLLIKIIPLIFLLIFPKRLVQLIGVPVLIHWRTIVVIILLITVVVLSFKNKKIQRESIEGSASG
jgi:hypothetical protein